MYSHLHLYMVKKEIQGLRGILAVLLLNDTDSLSSSLPHLWLCFVSRLLSLWHITSQKEPPAPDRTCLWLLKKGWLANPIRILLKMEFCNLSLARRSTTPSCFKGDCSGFHKLCVVIPQLWAERDWPVRNCCLYKPSLCNHCSLRRAVGLLTGGILLPSA